MATLGTVRSAKGFNVGTLTATTVVPAGSNRVLYVWLLIRSSTSTGTGVTFDGSGSAVALSLVDTLVGATSARLELWRLIAPAAASGSVVATLTGSPSSGWMVLAEPWSDVDQTTPNSAMSKATGTTNAPSVTIASASGEVVADAVVHNLLTGNPFAAGAGQTEDFDDAQTAMSGAASHEAGAASVTMSWTASSAAQWAQGAIAIRSSVSDVNAPSSVSTYTVTADRAGAAVSHAWTNPGDVDFIRIKILRRTDQFPTGPTDAGATTVLDTSTGHTIGAADSYAETGLTNGTLYYYAIYAADVTPNYSAGVTANAVAHTPPTLNTPAADAVVLPAPIFAFELSTDDMRPSIAIHCVFEYGLALDPVDSTAIDAPTAFRSRSSQSGWFYTPSAGSRTAMPVGGIPSSAAKPIVVEYESTITTPSAEIIYWSAAVDQI